MLVVHEGGAPGDDEVGGVGHPATVRRDRAAGWVRRLMDTANTAAFRASGGAETLTGQILVVDGGSTMRWEMP
ncbi:hypothetical protein GCM10017557_62540 [Streptomyces aurantiacus]|uniref:SDR family oxidoreductase n=1 Tax=Streptomyces aurantiacus TaxID=47760 RepID=A0A7G1PE89_9ACTN|nr:hypothetical protein GCM10017557_62540 [Streptomyces aurantiacus]